MSEHIHVLIDNIVSAFKTVVKTVEYDEAFYNKLEIDFRKHFDKNLAMLLMLVASNSGTCVSILLPQSIAPISTNIRLMQGILDSMFKYSEMRARASRNEDCSIRIEFSWNNW